MQYNHEARKQYNNHEPRKQHNIIIRRVTNTTQPLTAWPMQYNHEARKKYITTMNSVINVTYPAAE